MSNDARKWNQITIGRFATLIIFFKLKSRSVKNIKDTETMENMRKTQTWYKRFISYNVYIAVACSCEHNNLTVKNWWYRKAKNFETY
jgi:hypothetical protein